MITKRILQRKKNLEGRLAKHGISELSITYLPYLEYDETEFAKSYVTGCRMMILYAAAFVAAEQDERELVVEWLKRENIWSYVSPKELQLFEGKIIDEESLDDFLWESECAYILAWTLNLVDDCPSPTEEISDENLDNFIENVPEIGEKLGEFLSNLSYRSIEEIFDENIFNELTTTYFRDLMFNGKTNTSDLNKHISFLRHRTLNWLRRFSGIEEWDKVDTST